MWKKSRIGFAVAVGSLLSLTSDAAEPQTQPRIPPPASQRPGAASPRSFTQIKVIDATPEDALRTFMLALMAQDETALRAVSLPNDGLDLLLKGQPAPPDVIKDATAQFARRPMKRLKEGEKVPLPRGKQYVVARGDTGDDRAMVLPEGAPVPTRLQKVAGHWKVAADPFIAARKAADTARKKVEAKSAVPTKPGPRN